MSPLARLLAVLLAALGLHSAVGATGPASDVRSIRIHSAAGVSVTATKPAEVAAIVRWFDALPRFVARPCPLVPRTPPQVSFEFRGPGGRVTLRATDRAPGTCTGEVLVSDIGQVEQAPLADNGFVARVSKLLGVSFDPNAKTDENRAEANFDAANHLRLVRVPAGSRPLSKPRSTPRKDQGYFQAEWLRAWKVHRPFADVVAFEKAHPPLGSRLGSTFPDNTSAYTNSLTVQFLYRPFRGRISGRAVNVEIDPLPGGWTRISVDAFDHWLVVRSINAKVPAGVREIVVHGHGRHPRRITRPNKIAHAVGLINSLPIAQPDGPVCFGALVPSSAFVTIDFLGAGGTELASVSGVDLAGACYSGIFLSVHGRHGVQLIGGHAIRRIERLAR